MAQSSFSAQPEVLKAEGLRKSYGLREALRGLSFSLRAGRILGFLGPNGAGKTTAIRILTTILEPDAGRFVVDGISSEHPEQIRQRIGVLPESLGFHKQMTGLECLEFFGRLYGQSAAEATAKGLGLLKDVGLDQRSKSLVGTYSRGMRQRLGIARSLINDPAVVFLDEPTLGLDPRGQQELLALVQWIARERHAGVVLCSHLLAEVESVCDDVIILSSGSVASTGTVAEVIGHGVQENHRRNGIRIQVPLASVDHAGEVLRTLSGIVNVSAANESGGWIRVEAAAATPGVIPDQAFVNNRMLDALIRANIPILNFQQEGGRLHDVFLHLTEEVIA